MSTALCTLDDLVFRINPTDIKWNFQVHTNVENTVGGRVVQVLGAALSDIVIRGYYGEDREAEMRYLRQHPEYDGSNSMIPGRPERLAEDFVTAVRRIMEKQAPPPNRGPNGYQRPMPVRWIYPARKWDYSVFVKQIRDLSGSGVVTHQTGKLGYGYQLTLVPVSDNTLHLTGDSSSLALQKAKDRAISLALSRISSGIGWQKTGYNDPALLGVTVADLSATPTDNTQNDTPQTQGSRTGGVRLN